MKAVFLDYATVDAGDLDLQSIEACTSELIVYPNTRDDEVAARIAGFEVVLTNKLALTTALLNACPQLKLVCLSATGTDNIDLAAARRHGVAVCNIRDYCTGSVVQHVFALLLTLARNLDRFRVLTARGAWQTSGGELPGLPVADLADLTLGVVGYGVLGRAVAEQGRSFGMDVLVTTRSGREPHAVPLEELLRRADVVSLHCPLNDQTRELIGRETLAAMRPGAILINTARGGLVDSSALADALRHGVLGGAGIDVLPEEPPVHGDPLLEDDVPNLVLTPHVAWASRRARQQALEEMAANIRAFARGERLNRVD